MGQGKGLEEKEGNEGQGLEEEGICAYSVWVSASKTRAQSWLVCLSTIKSEQLR